jgi:hypothetical protein
MGIQTRVLGRTGEALITAAAEAGAAQPAEGAGRRED